MRVRARRTNRPLRAVFTLRCREPSGGFLDDPEAAREDALASRET